MKITIESEELFSLRERLKEREEDIRDLQERLKGLSEEQIEKRVKSLSWKLFEKYLELTFKKLGFTKPYFSNPVVACGLWQQLDEAWFEKEDEITMSIGANVEEDGLLILLAEIIVLFTIIILAIWGLAWCYYLTCKWLPMP